jgi:hypothetical protein
MTHPTRPLWAVPSRDLSEATSGPAWEDPMPLSAVPALPDRVADQVAAVAAATRTPTDLRPPAQRRPLFCSVDQG